VYHRDGSPGIVKKQNVLEGDSSGIEKRKTAPVPAGTGAVYCFFENIRISDYLSIAPPMTII
jgi:hypothetical protein